jgi:DNA (cytosine-5)-methyltransferase 1
LWYTKSRRAQNNEDYETWIVGGVSPTLNAFDNTGDKRATVLMAIPIQDGRAMNKKQNGIGIGTEGDPSYTLDQTGSQSIAIPIQGTIIGRQDHNGPQGKGFGDEGDPSYTLDSISQHGVATDMQVRRLTPLECERLMGWPDNHTLPRADGKQNSDTTRYKMCGNGVATPVAKWIGEKIVGIQQSTPRL